AGGEAEHRILVKQAREFSIGPGTHEILLVDRRNRRAVGYGQRLQRIIARPCRQERYAHRVPFSRSAGSRFSYSMNDWIMTEFWAIRNLPAAWRRPRVDKAVSAFRRFPWSRRAWHRSEYRQSFWPLRPAIPQSLPRQPLRRPRRQEKPNAA